MKALKGRKRRTLAEQEQLAGEFHRSGMTLGEFARREGVHPLTVAGWMRRFPRSGPGPEPEAAFVAVTVRSAAPAAAGRLEVVSPSGWRLRFASDSEVSVIRPFLGLLGPC
jgi:transposase-like protein